MFAALKSGNLASYTPPPQSIVPTTTSSNNQGGNTQLKVVGVPENTDPVRKFERHFVNFHYF